MELLVVTEVTIGWVKMGRKVDNEDMNEFIEKDGNGNDAGNGFGIEKEGSTVMVGPDDEDAVIMLGVDTNEAFGDARGRGAGTVGGVRDSSD